MSVPQAQLTRSVHLPGPVRRSYLWPGVGLIIAAIIGTVLLVVIGAGVSLGAVTSPVWGASFDVVSAGLGVWLLSLAIWWVRRSKRFDLFEFPIWFSFSAYVQVIMNVWLLQRGRMTYIPWLQSNYTEMMTLAVVLYGAGLTAMWAGYVRFAGRAVHEGVLRQAPATEPRLFNVCAIWVLGWLVNAFWLATGGSSYLGSGGGSTWANYTGFVMVVYYAATAVLVIWHFRQPRPIGWVWLGFMVLSEIAISLISGSKGFAVTLVFLAMCVFYARRRLPVRWLAIGFLLIVLLVPVVNSFRLSLLSISSDRGVALVDRVPLVVSALVDAVRQPIGHLFQNTGDTFKARQGSLMDVTASALYLHPTHLPYVGMEMVEYFFPQLVPRALFPWKSTTAPQFLQITQTYFGLRLDVASAIGLVADAYRAGGWIAEVMVLFTVGAVGAWLYRRGPGTNSFLGAVFYVVLITHVVRYDVDIMTCVLHLIQWGILLWVVLSRVMFEPERGQAALRRNLPLSKAVPATQARTN